MESQNKLGFAGSGPSSTVVLKRTEAELKMAVLSASCDIPLAFHDHLSPTIRRVFSDSEVASNYHSAATKATCMLNLAVAPTLIEVLLERMKVQPFSISIDGSNDTDLKKMKTVTVKLFDINSNRVVTRFLDMCMSRSSSAEGIFSVVNQKLLELLQCEQPWNMCTSVGVDNTSVNTGVRNSLRTRVLGQNPAIYFNGCPCHILHNAA